MKPLPKDWKDELDLYQQTRHGRNSIFERSKSVPGDSVIELEQELLRRNLWHDPRASLQLLKLSRSPILTMWQIAKELNKTFNETRYTANACTGRLDRLRNLAAGYYIGQDHGKRIIREIGNHAKNPFVFQNPKTKRRSRAARPLNPSATPPPKSDN